MTANTITCPVRKWSTVTPDSVLLRDSSNSVSFRNADKIVERCMQRLAALGCQPGDRIAVLSGNSIDYAITVFACLRCGISIVPMNLRLSPQEWSDMILLADCMAVVLTEEYKSFASEVDVPAASFDDLVSPPEEDSSDSPAGTEYEASINTDQEAAVVFTSGSEGVPKGVRLTSGNLIHSAEASNENIKLDPGDCWLAVLPFYHVGGMSIQFRTALAGCSTYAMRSFDVRVVNDLIDFGGISHISLVPTMLDSLLTNRGSKPLPGSLKAILLGGSSVSPQLRKTVIDKSLPVLFSYGLTEASSQVCTNTPSDSGDKLLTSGKPLNHVRVRIVDRNGGDVDSGADGEIMIKGSGVFSGYLGDIGGDSFTDGGWFRTGDVGRIDAQGYLRVVGRIDDMLVSGGENVHSSSIERVALSYSHVAECAVIAVEDDKWGKRPILFVKPSSASLNISDLVAHLEINLSRMMIPDMIIALDELPKKTIDKIDRERLLEIYRERQT